MRYRAVACIKIQKTVRMWLCKRKHKPRSVASWFLNTTHTCITFHLFAPFALLFICLPLPDLHCVLFFCHLNVFPLDCFWWLSHIVHFGVQINLESHLWRHDVSRTCFGKCLAVLGCVSKNGLGKSSHPNDGFFWWFLRVRISSVRRVRLVSLSVTWGFLELYETQHQEDVMLKIQLQQTNIFLNICIFYIFFRSVVWFEKWHKNGENGG